MNTTAATLIIDLVTGQFSFMGGPRRMNRRGEGIVIHDTGIVVLDADNNIIFEAVRTSPSARETRPSVTR